MTSESWSIRESSKRILREAGLSLVGDTLRLPGGCSRIKIDIGLSVNAPQSAVWLGANPDLVVLGVEPVIENVEQLRLGLHNWPTQIDPALIGERMFVLPIAVDDVEEPTHATMFVTQEDPGCSSLLEPTAHTVEDAREVEVWPLSEILQFLPFDSVPFVEHIKIDAQGKDLNIFKSAREWRNRVLAVTLEAESSGYRQSHNSLGEIRKYMKEIDFVEVSKFTRTYWPPQWKVQVADPTFINPEVYFTHRPQSLFLYQSG